MSIGEKVFAKPDEKNPTAYRYNSRSISENVVKTRVY